MSGTLTAIAYPEAMARVLQRSHIRCFDLAQYVEPIREQIRKNAERLAAEHGLQIQFLPKHDTRKEEIVAEVLARRGPLPGLVHILSAMETCTTYQPWHDKATGRTGVKFKSGKCLHYYFYFLDPELGLCYVRVPTWAPYRLQVWFNGHHWLASRLKQARLTYRMEDTAFVEISDWARAQELSDDFSVLGLHQKLASFARRYCPPSTRFTEGYHWSVMQAEYALDVVFRRAEDLHPLYEEISRQAVLAVRIDEMVRFWDKRLSAEAKAASRFFTRVEGTCIRHHLGRQSIKMYDRGGRILRIETTSNDITFFHHHRKVEHRDGSSEYKVAALKKSIYSLTDLDELMAAACRRYLDFVGTLEDHTVQRHDLDHISRTARDKCDRSWRGFNFFLTEDLTVLLALLRGEFAINGLSGRRLRAVLTGKKPAQIGRILKRLRLHGLIRRVGHTYRYYLTNFARRALVAARKLTEHLIIPALVRVPA
ncbi:MAG: hypothetical protein Q7R45_05055 [Sulfuricaulis sp.]|nr:hypothetical protein [Sulfuricaulis sp.]